MAIHRRLDSFSLIFYLLLILWVKTELHQNLPPINSGFQLLRCLSANKHFYWTSRAVETLYLSWFFLVDPIVSLAPPCVITMRASATFFTIWWYGISLLHWQYLGSYVLKPVWIINIILNYTIFLQFIYFLNQPIKWLLMCYYRHKNHFLVPYLQYTAKVNCFWINLFLFFPLHNKLIHNWVNHLSCHCRLINSVKDFNILILPPAFFLYKKGTATAAPLEIIKFGFSLCNTFQAIIVFLIRAFILLFVG